MSDNLAVTSGAGSLIAMDEVVDATLGTVKVQYVKLMDGTLDGTTKGVIGANGLYVEVRATVAQPVTSALSSQVDGHSATMGITTGAAVITDAAGTVQQYLRGLVKWAFERMPASLGQKAMAAAFPVSIASDQSPIMTQGSVAHGGGLAGNPVRIGGRAQSGEYSAVTTGAVADITTDLYGRIQTQPYADPSNNLSGFTTNMITTADTSVIAAQGASVRIYVTTLTVGNAQGSAPTWVNIKDGATTLLSLYAPAGATMAYPFVKPLRLTGNAVLNAACETAGAGVRVSAAGYRGG